MEYKALPQKGFISKTISVIQKNNEQYQILVEIKPTGSESHQDILLFNRKELLKLINSINDMAGRKVY